MFGSDCTFTYYGKYRIGKCYDLHFFLILYAILWLLLAGAADAEPAKMACSIINTLTTLLLILVNVLAVWGKGSDIPGLNLFPWEKLQNYSVVLLLPLVVNGYLAALLKELQDYWSRKQEKETAESSDPKEDRSLPRD